MDTDAAAAAAESAAPAVAGAHEASHASAAERSNNAADDVDRRSRSDHLPPAKQVRRFTARLDLQDLLLQGTLPLSSQRDSQP